MDFTLFFEQQGEFKGFDLSLILPHAVNEAGSVVSLEQPPRSLTSELSSQNR